MTYYTVCSGKTHDELEKNVNKLLRKGYKCVGGIAVEKTWIGKTFYQSMTIDSNKNNIERSR